MRLERIYLGCILVLVLEPSGWAQIDPVKRELVQIGYNQHLQGHGPFAGYGFYYLNLPHLVQSNYTLRLAAAPVYLDAELGVSQALGQNTDVGFGVAGGGFADSYDEIRRGKYARDESFTGHGGGISTSVYHRFNPHQTIPLNGIVRGEAYSSFYSRDDETADDFELPNDRMNFALRTGLRYGGQEPLLSPSMAMELSAWYESLLRTDSERYGFANDRDLEPVSHLAWARALLAYTLPECQHVFAVNLTLGTSLEADRFSAYRLGGILPLAAEFPLTLPGYYHQEISARRFVLLGGNYSLPLDKEKRWTLNGVAATAGVEYVRGLEQPGRWHSGVGAGFGYRSRSDVWQVSLGYAYGVDAIRSHGRGGHSLGILLQFDLERAQMPFFEPGNHPLRSRGLQRLFHFQ